ncbi:MAG: IS110 family transposase [Candidatus Zixiibacteriota bacterium]
MSAERLCIGVDVAQASLAVWACTPDKRSQGSRTFENRRAGFAQLVRWARQLAVRLECTPIHVGMESTGVYGQALAAYLYQAEGITVSVINPAQIKHAARANGARTKTDRTDAQQIAVFVAEKTPPTWQPESPAVVHLRALVQRLEQLKEMQVQERNHRHAASHGAHTATDVLTSIDESLVVIHKQIAALQKRLRRHLDTHPELRQQTDLLQTIDGIGEWTAARMIARAGRALVERSGRELVAHAGLAPGERQSGTSLHTPPRLVKIGRADLRWALYMPAVCGSKHNPVLRALFQRIVAKGRPPIVAIIACMRKLLHIIHGVLKTQTPFNPALHLTSA